MGIKTFFSAMAICQGILVGSLISSASAAAIPSGWTCAGSCGSDGADGVVTLSPTGNSAYQWVSTYNGIDGTGALPGVGGSGTPTNGSTLSTTMFSAAAGAPLNFYFNYVTSDGSGYADYAWAELLNSANTAVALLFTARTAPSGSIVPGFSMPNPAATLTPGTVPIIDGAPTWSPLGDSSDLCFDAGCGYTGWIQSSYVIPPAGNYSLEIGVVNWDDEEFDSGLAVDGVTVAGAPIPTGTTPEPGTILLLGSGMAALGVFRMRQLRAKRA